MKFFNLELYDYKTVFQLLKKLRNIRDGIKYDDFCDMYRYYIPLYLILAKLNDDNEFIEIVKNIKKHDIDYNDILSVLSTDENKLIKISNITGYRLTYNYVKLLKDKAKTISDNIGYYLNMDLKFVNVNEDEIREKYIRDRYCYDNFNLYYTAVRPSAMIDFETFNVEDKLRKIWSTIVPDDYTIRQNIKVKNYKINKNHSYPDETEENIINEIENIKELLFKLKKII